MGTRKLWTEEMQAYFDEGTFVSIAARFLGGEDRTDFVKAAVRNEMLGAPNGVLQVGRTARFYSPKGFSFRGSPS